MALPFLLPFENAKLLAIIWHLGKGVISQRSLNREPETENRKQY
jgi:hypothetical protein